MATRPAPVLDRDNPDKEPLVGHVKVTRDDWLNLSRDVLVNDGVAEVKILSLSDRLGVSRSSFYGYFENRADLLSALLEEWAARNTRQIVTHCQMPAPTISHAVFNFFRCFVDPALFDPGLDFAVREWSRRDEALRARVDAADKTRLDALREMFARHGYAPAQVEARARILYFMQLGYHALEVRESIAERMSLVETHMLGFTGEEADPAALQDFRAYVQGIYPDYIPPED